MMAKNWSKGTHPLDSEQKHISTPHQESSQEEAATPVSEVVESIKDAASGDEASRRFLLRVIQPGLAGLMDGSVSTLAPIFAAAFVTHHPFTAFIVGIAAATGAGISMAFSEALSDDGQLTRRGNPLPRGGITGAMTFFGGSLHTLPFLVPDLHV